MIIRCQHCDGQVSVDAGTKTATCPSCGRLTCLNIAPDAAGPEIARMPPPKDPEPNTLASDVRYIRRTLSAIAVMILIGLLTSCAVALRGCLQNDRQSTYGGTR